MIRECRRAVSSGPDPLRIELSDGSAYLGACPLMQKLGTAIRQVAQIDVPVLILGERGTGKELVARLLCQLSPRARRNFLKVNCTSVSPDQLETELFGYERKALARAERLKPGKLERCDGGTILLREIGEIPTALQVRLLNVIQHQEFARPGSGTNVPVDVRIIGTTITRTPEAMAATALCAYLCCRFGAVVLHVPPLRERRGDIEALLRHFLQRDAAHLSLPHRDLTPGLLRRCLHYDWPGNVRELENVAKRFLIFGEDALELVCPEVGRRARPLGSA